LADQLLRHTGQGLATPSGLAAGRCPDHRAALQVDSFRVMPTAGSPSTPTQRHSSTVPVKP
jgi:hypothetical protein